MDEIIRLFHSLQGRYDLWSVYTDYLEMMTISIQNILFKDQEREDRYLSIAKKYSRDELMTFTEIQELVVLEMEKEIQDVLGTVLMRLGLGYKWSGQFFTPNHIADLMADMVFDEGYTSVYDPACGGGVTLIAYVKKFLESGHNPQKELIVYGADLDRRSCYMTYIQLSILGIAAIIRNQDSLSDDKPMECFVTPWFYLNNWDYRLKHKAACLRFRKAFDEVKDLDKSFEVRKKEKEVKTVDLLEDDEGQLSLF